MKNLFIYTFSIFAFMFTFNLDCFAFDYTSVIISSEGSYISDNQYFPESFNFDNMPDSILDDNGHYIRGSVWTTVNDPYIGTFQSIVGNQFSGNNSVHFPNDNECMFVIHFDGSGSMQDSFGNNLNGYYLCWRFIPNNSDTDYSRIMGLAMYNAETDQKWRCYLRGVNSPSNIPNWLISPVYLGGFNIADGASIQTNLPIFEETSVNSIDNYISNGDISGASNSDILQPSLEVPNPIQLDILESSKTPYGNTFTNPIVIQWNSNYNADFNSSNMRFNLSYQITGTHVRTLPAESSTNFDTGVINVAINAKYKTDNTTYTISTKDLNDSWILSLANLNLLQDVCYVETVTVWITNVDGSDFNNVSGTESIQYNFKTKTESSSTDDNIDDGSEGGGDSEDGSSGIGDGSGINNSSGGVNQTVNFPKDLTITDNLKYNYFNQVSDTLTGKNAIIKDYIDSTFMNIGSNNLLSILATVMPFLPGEYWGIVSMGLSMSVGLLVIGALIRFIRG